MPATNQSSAEPCASNPFFGVDVPRSALILLLLQCLLVLETGAQSPLGPPSAETGLLLRDDITRALIQQSSGDLAHDNVMRLALWDRSQVTPGFSEAAIWVSEKAREYGLQEVQVERFPSGEGVEYFGNKTEKLWQVRKAELWMTEPYRVRLTTYAELPMSLARNSVDADIEAEVVDIGRGTTDDDYRSDVRGKIVLTESSPTTVWTQAVVKRGAAGIVSSWSVPGFDFPNRLPGDYPDQVGWGRISEVKPGDTSRPAFLISSRRAQEIRQILSRGKSLRMRLLVEASLKDGSLDVVSGVIPGTRYPNEELVITAHLDHYKPGSNDNASGSASVLEIVRTLNSLIASGVLSKPLRTVRVLWVPEYMGTWAWLAKHGADPVKRVANLNFDMLGEDLKQTNAKFAIGYTPDSNPSWLNGLMESILAFLNRYNDTRYPERKDFHIISLRGTRNRLQGTMEPASVGTDHELFNNLGVPATGPSGWPDNFYHSSEDTPDKTDATQLHRVVVIGLLALTTIIYADDEAALSIAEQTLEYGRTRIAQGEFRAAMIVTSSKASEFAGNSRRALSIIGHEYRREREAVRSVLLFAKSQAVQKAVRICADRLESEESEGKKRMDVRIEARAEALGVPVPRSAVTEAERRLQRLVPKRVPGKELISLNSAARSAMGDTTLHVRELGRVLTEAMQRMRNEGVPELRLMGAVDAIGYYADGRRTMHEIREEYAAEFTLIDPETIERLFRVFEKAGVMEISGLSR